MENIVVTFITALLACVAAIAIYNWIRAEADERAWRRILDEENDYLPLYRLINVEDKDRDRE